MRTPSVKGPGAEGWPIGLAMGFLYWVLFDNITVAIVIGLLFGLVYSSKRGQ